MRNEPDYLIVHFGLGQFAKAHVLAYTNRVNSEHEAWGVIGVSLNSPAMRDRLREQDWLYTLTLHGTDSQSMELIEVIDQVLYGQEDNDELRSMLLSPKTQILSFTVTEKGYYLTPDGDLDLSQALLKHDIDHPDNPRTTIGWLVWTIRNRRKLGLPPITPLALDNLNQNGSILKSQVLALANLTDRDLAAYIDENVHFPCSMVDRIVPAIDEQQIEAVAQNLGLRDGGCVIAEAFGQWALEDKFSSRRPAWERAGVMVCEETESFEQMKLRLLNGAHSAIAYLGCLLGHDTVADCMANRPLHDFIASLLKREIQPEVTPPAGIDLVSYIGELLERFSNPNLHHFCRQIAMDGSQKIPQRWVPVVYSRLSKGLPGPGLAFAVAAWTQYVQEAEPLNDPIAADLKRLVLAHPEDPIGALLLQSGIFSGVAEALLTEVKAAAEKIQRLGFASAMASVYNEPTATESISDSEK